MEITKLIEKRAKLIGLRTQTIKTYSVIVEKFFRTYRKEPHLITKKDIENHLLRLLEKNKSGNTVNVHLNAIKFFYEKVLNKKLTLNLQFFKTRKRIPTYLTKEEVIHFFSCIDNKKHKLMITLLYSAGLRVSELLNLKVKDLEINHGWVRDGKGGKDRIFIIAGKLKKNLESWIILNNLCFDNYLFNNNSKQMSSNTVRLIIKNAIMKAGISKHVTPHTLRHSFATHLVENGYAVTDLQPLLGHSKLETTMIYTHMASPKLLKVISPYDELQ